MTYTSNFLQDILEAVGNETIEAVVINSIDGKINEYRFEDEEDPIDIPPEKCNISLTLEEASPLLNYTYDYGFGRMDCHNIHVWTAVYVYYIHEYDGATSLEAVPRNPPPR